MIKFIMNMNNSRTHPNLGADRWGPQIYPMGKSLAGSGRQFGATILQVGPATLSTDGVTQSQISVRLICGPTSGWVDLSLTLGNHPTTPSEWGRVPAMGYSAF
jgi:hypothetical protein